MQRSTRTAGGTRHAERARQSVRHAWPQHDRGVTLVYVHGIGNQPARRELKRQWDVALTGHELGSRSRMAYWVNRRRYPVPVRAGRVLPLPPELAAWVAGQIAWAVMPDVHDFLCRPARRRAMERCVSAVLDRCSGPVAIVAHSQGSMIAYSMLRRRRRARPRVRLLLTLGSPLGLAEVQQVLRRALRSSTLRCPPSVERWVNIADRLDVVAADAHLANDFHPTGFVTDIVRPGLNLDAPLRPHSATGYLRAPTVRAVIAKALGRTDA